MEASHVLPSRSSRTLSSLIRPARFAVLLVLLAGMLAGGAWGGELGQVQVVAVPMEVPDVLNRSTDLGHSDPARVLHIAVSLPYADPDGVQAFVDSVSDPASPNYRQFITPEEVGDLFGLPDDQVQSVVDYLASAGFQINLVGKNHLSILADATVAQAEAAFNTEIHEFQALSADEPGNTRYFSYTTVPTLPPTIAPYVIDVTGLESFTKPQHRILTPTKTRTLYGVAPLYSAGTQGQGRTVAISNWDGYRLTNVPLYYSQYGLPTPPGGVGSNITVITISGGAGSGSPGGEGDLDIQMPLGIAPLCSLRIYDGGNSDLIGVLTSEANQNLADTISESYGWNIGTSTANSAHNLHVSMSAQGITYMAASGDSGTTLEPYSYPDYEPEVLSVGGTVATTNSSGVRTSEVAWSSGGGGWSTKSISFNVLPSWQHGTNVPTTINKRLVPDVALSSSGSGGAYYFYYNGGLSSGSVGTSFASPIFAGALAVAEQQIISQGGLPPDGSGHRRFGRIQNLFYSQNGRSDVWYDVTSGSNGTLPNGSASNAGTAWDFCTGWGAINFSAFAATQVNTAPTITGQPQSQSGCTGGSVTFTVVALGTAPLTYQWRKDGSDISGANSSSYTINPVAAGDAGGYDCVVTNAFGSATSNVATLAVGTAPSITTQPQSQAACIGSSVTLTVVATGSAPFTYQWRWNGSNIGGATSSSYTINPVTQFSAGNYDCIVTNACGTTTSNAATLTTKAAPAIVGPPNPQEVCAGASVTFTVGATGSAPLSYQWRKNGVNIGGATGFSYTLNPVAPGDAADYDCVVTNSCGSATSDPATLTVDTSPAITTDPSSQTVAPGGSVTFTVAANGTAPLSYQWRKDGSDIGGATSSSYTINPVAAGDAGSYDCVVTNLCGSATSNAATLTVSSVLLGDMNCDGVVNNQDIDPFVMALFNPAGYAAAYPNCNILNGDFTGDGNLNNQDIDGFVAALFGS